MSLTWDYQARQVDEAGTAHVLTCLPSSDGTPWVRVWPLHEPEYVTVYPVREAPRRMSAADIAWHMRHGNSCEMCALSWQGLQLGGLRRGRHVA